MNIEIKNLQLGDEKINRLLAFMDGEDIQWSVQPNDGKPIVSGSLDFWHKKLIEVDDEITKVHFSPFLLQEAKSKREKIRMVIRLSKELSANDR